MYHTTYLYVSIDQINSTRSNIGFTEAVRQKLQLLEECSLRLQRSAKHSICSAAATMGVSHVLLVKWYQERPRIEASLGKSKAICDGPTGQLDCIKEELLQWIFSP